jgi:TIR domain
LSKLFISYNHKDQLFVQAIKEKLADLSYPDQEDIFYDETSLTAGDNWIKKIQEAIFTSSSYIVFIGVNGIGPFQQKEVLAAVNEQVKRKAELTIIPVILPQDGHSLSKEIPWFLADYQWVEFTNTQDNIALDKLMEGIRANDSDPVILDRDPYKGLNYFEVDDSPFFFGRQFDVNWIFYKKLKLGTKGLAKNFLAVIGSSGSGKSSFVRAGILAALKNGKYKGSGDWPRLIMTPGSKPMTNLAAILEHSGIIKDAYTFSKEAIENKNRLYLAAEVYQHRFVLFIDQLEEVISQCGDASERTAFLENIAEAGRSDKILILTTLRTDFYSRFSGYKTFADLIEESNYTLEDIELSLGDQYGELQNEERERKLKDIIIRPAGLCGVKIGEGLAQKLVEETRGINGPLPVLQMTLSKLWQQESRMNKKEISSSDFDQLSGGKGLDGIIEKHADDVYDEFTSKGSDKTRAALVKNIFIRLVELTESREDVRKSVSKSEILNQLSGWYETAEVEKAIDYLSGPDARLIRVKKDEKLKQDSKDNYDSIIEVMHEVLIRKWGKLVGWVNERREALRYRNLLENIITRLEIKKRLLKGDQLNDAKDWQTNNPDLGTAKTRNFISRSVRRRRIIQGVLATLVLITAFLGWNVYDTIKWNEFKRSKIAERYNPGKIDSIKFISIQDSTDFQYLHYYKNCDSLLIFYGAKLKNLKKLERLPGIRSLCISGIELESLSGLEKLTGLINLKVYNIDSLKDISSIQSLSKLKVLGY